MSIVYGIGDGSNPVSSNIHYFLSYREWKKTTIDHHIAVPPKDTKLLGRPTIQTGLVMANRFDDKIENTEIKPNFPSFVVKSLYPSKQKFTSSNQEVRA